MANQEHLDLLKQGSTAWNAWRVQYRKIRPDLSGANLSNADLSGTDLSFADLSFAHLDEANLSFAYLNSAVLSGADLTFAHLNSADLSFAYLNSANFMSAELIKANLYRADLRAAELSLANLSNADLRGANLCDVSSIGTDLSRANLSFAYLTTASLYRADLSGTDLSGANLSDANLSSAILVNTNLANTTLKDCSIYGISAWDVQLDEAEQLNLKITPEDQPTITVDNLKIAQFIYLLLNNKEIRDVINALTMKSVLILGRFTPERKAVLDALREAVRQHDYLPILFDFDRPDTRDISETVTTLARLARFIIADLTDAKSIPQELAFIVPHLPSVPVQPILVSSQSEYGMFEHFKRYPWVLPIHRYTDLSDLLASLKEQIIKPAETKAKELEKP